MNAFSRVVIKDHRAGGCSFGNAPAIKSGWNRIELDRVGKERLTRSGSAKGALFTFRVVSSDAAGQTFRQWFCTEALDQAMEWSQSVFENAMIRIAQCVGIARLESPADLCGRPFWANLDSRTDEWIAFDEVTGEEIVRKTRCVRFKSGRIEDVILPGTEYLLRLAEEARERDRAARAQIFERPF